MRVRFEQYPGYAWRRINGKDTLKTAFARKTVTVFGALDTDGYHMRTAKARNTVEFIKILEGMNKIRPKTLIVLDNAPYHKSKAVWKFIKGAGVAVELILPPAYTPQLNPTEARRRVLKRLLRGMYFASIEEMAGAIASLVAKRRMRPVKIMRY